MNQGTSHLTLTCSIKRSASSALHWDLTRNTTQSISSPPLGAELTSFHCAQYIIVQSLQDTRYLAVFALSQFLPLRSTIAASAIEVAFSLFASSSFFTSPSIVSVCEISNSNQTIFFQHIPHTWNRHQRQQAIAAFATKTSPQLRFPCPLLRTFWRPCQETSLQTCFLIPLPIRHIHINQAQAPAVVIIPIIPSIFALLFAFSILSTAIWPLRCSITEFWWFPVGFSQMLVT